MRHFRFKSISSIASRELSVKSAAVVLACSTLLSALLGLFRDYRLNSYYLQTYPTGIDAYTAAFVIPDFMFLILTSGSFSSFFIPIFNQRLVSGNKKSAWEFCTSSINFCAIGTFIISILIMIFAEPLTHLVAPGLDESGMTLAINMARVIAINPFLFSIATILNSVQHATKRFIFYALAPALYNLGIIIGILGFTNGINIFGIQIFEGGIMGVALGVVFGAILQLIVSLVGLIGLDTEYNFKINWKNHGFRTLLKLLPTRSFGQIVTYAKSFVNTNISSRMGAGVLRSFNQANTLSQMPVSLIGVAISSAFFPKFTEEVGEGNETKFYDSFRASFRAIAWIAMPVTIIAFFGRAYCSSFINNLKNGGSNTLISSILGALVIMIFVNSVYQTVIRYFYAHQDAKTPVIVSILGVIVTVAISILFYNLNFGPIGLGIAQSIGITFELIVLLIIMQRRSKNQILTKSFWWALIRMGIATLVTGCVAYGMVKLVPLMATDDSIFITLPKFMLITLVSLIAYIIMCSILKLEEPKPIFKFLRKILFRNVE